MSDSLLTDLLTVGIGPAIGMLAILMCGRLFGLALWLSIPLKFFVWGSSTYLLVHLRLEWYKDNTGTAQHALLHLAGLALLALLTGSLIALALKASDSRSDKNSTVT